MTWQATIIWRAELVLLVELPKVSLVKSSTALVWQFVQVQVVEPGLQASSARSE